MDKVAVCQGVADQIGATEASLDQAIADASKLLAEMIQARQTLKFAAACGDAAIAKVSQAIATLSEARSTVVSAHEELHEVKLRLGVRTRMDSENPWQTLSQQDASAETVLKRVV